MNTLFDFLNDAWSYAKQLTIVSFIKDAIKGGKEVFSEIGEWLEVIFQYVLYIIPIWATIHYLSDGYVVLTIIYLFFGTFVTLFNDSGPIWLSYIMLWFWLPILMGDLFIVEPGKWILRKVGLMKPKYTPEEIKLSKHLAEQGKKIIERNKNKKNK